MDELKKYFKEQETNMQFESPDEQLIWERLEAASQKKKSAKPSTIITMRFAVAACLVLLIGLGIIVLFKKGSSKTIVPHEIVRHEVPVIKQTVINIDTTAGKQQLVATTEAEKNPKQTVRIKPAKQEQPMAEGFSQLVDYQLKKLRSTPVYAENAEYFSLFIQQLQQMDADEALLKKDMESYGVNDKLLEALINIYQQKLSLLKNLQGEIHKMNTAVKRNGSPEELHAYYLNL